MAKLQLGCGKKAKKGYVNLDIVKFKGVDVSHDLEKFPYPFKNNSFEEIYCSHILEHLTDLGKVMKELQRISKPNAKIKVIAPYFSGQGAYNDPSHKRFFTYKTFEYFRPGNRIKSGFRIIKRKIFFFSSKEFMKSRIYSLPPDLLINIFPILYQRFFCYILPSSEVHFLLEVNK